MNIRELTQDELAKWGDALPPDDRFNTSGGGQMALVFTEDDNEQEHVIPVSSIIEIYFDAIGELHIVWAAVSYTFVMEQAKAFVVKHLSPYFHIDTRLDE